MAEVKIALNVNSEEGTQRVSAFNQHIVSAMDQIKVAGADTSVKIADAFQQVSVNSGALTKQWNKLYSASEILASGIKKVRNIIEGILWGTIIGAVSAVVTKLIDYVIQSQRSEEATSQLAEAVRKQAEAWQLLPDKLKDVTEASVDLYNVQLRQAQFLERNEGGRLQQQIKDLTSLNEQLQRNVGGLEKYTGALDESTPFAGKLLDDLKGRILQNNVAIAEAIKKQEDWQSLMSMSPATFSAVAASVSGVTKTIDDLNISLKTQIKDLDMQIIKLRDGEDAYLEAIRQRQIAQGADIKIVDALIKKQRELNDLQKQGELNKLIAEKKQPEWKPMVDLPTAPAFAPGEREGITAMEDKHKNASSWIKEETELMKGLTGQYGEHAQELAVTTMANETLFAVKQNMANALAQEILGQQNYGKALQNATAQALASVAARMAVEAIYMTGIGIAALTPWGAALFGPAPVWFKAAAYMGAGAVTAGVMARAIYSPPSEKEQKSRKELEATQPPANINTSTETQRPTQIVNIYANGNLIDLSQLSRELRYYNVQLERDMV